MRDKCRESACWYNERGLCRIWEGEGKEYLTCSSYILCPDTRHRNSDGYHYEMIGRKEVRSACQYNVVIMENSDK